MIQHQPLLGRVAPAVTPIRTGGATGNIGLFGPTRRNADGTPKQHNGVDLLCVMSWPVFAVHAGIVSVAGWESDTNHAQGYGQRVKVESTGKRLRTVYAHLSHIRVAPGQRVMQGELLGLAGRTGNIGDDVSIPTHLHFEVHEGDGAGNWTPVDPVKWIFGDSVV